MSELMHDLESRWQEATPETINLYEPLREDFRVATARVVADTLEKYIPEAERIVELGSGAGEMLDLVPANLKEKIIQVEISDKLAKENKTEHQNADVVEASAYELPFRDESVDAIMGFSSFDTLEDLSSAFSEAKRVLTTDGKIVHFLDIPASPETLFAYYRDSDYIPFPEIESSQYIAGARLVRKDQLEGILDRCEPTMAGLIEAYIADPESGFLGFNTEANISTGVVFSKIMAEVTPDSETVGLNEFFYKSAKEALEKQGFEINKMELVQRSAIVNGEARARLESKYGVGNSYSNLIGRLGVTSDYSLEEHLSPDEAEVVNAVHVIVATKKS